MTQPNGTIILLRDVPINNSYEHTIDFKNANEQYAYWRSFLKTELNNYTYIRREREYIAVERKVSELEDVNYMIFRSTADERLYYAFVTDVRYVAPDTSEIYYEIDVMQTFMFDYEFKPTYIEQAHVDRWTAEHKPVYSKTAEGLDYGTEYAIEGAFKIEQSEKVKWLLVSCKQFNEIITEGFVPSGGNNGLAPSPFVTLLIPIIVNRRASGSNYFGVRATGVIGFDNVTVTEPRGVADYGALTNLMLNAEFGNYIHSISMLNYLPFIDNERANDTTGYIDVQFNDAEAVIRTTVLKVGEVAYNVLVLSNVFNAGQRKSMTLAVADWDIGIENSLPNAEMWSELKKNPYTTPRDKRFESKLLCYPYRYNLLSDWRNDSVVLKNEYLTTNKLKLKYSYALSYNAPCRYYVEDYKKDVEGRNACVVQAMGLEFPIIRDEYFTYMNENKNTIQANLTNAKINAVASTMGGAISGAGIGGVGGAVYGGVTGAVQGALSVSAVIRNQNALQQDLRAKPDTVINSVDSSFNVVDDNINLNFYRMRICCENEAIIADFFNMFGYKVNKLDIPNTRSRTRFNYLKTVNANITGGFAQKYLAEIKRVLNNGITFWHYSANNFNPLDYSYENIEVNLL